MDIFPYNHWKFQPQTNTKIWNLKVGRRHLLWDQKQEIWIKQCQYYLKIIIQELEVIRIHKHCLLVEDMVYQNIKEQALQFLIQEDQSGSSNSVWFWLKFRKYKSWTWKLLISEFNVWKRSLPSFFNMGFWKKSFWQIKKRNYIWL